MMMLVAGNKRAAVWMSSAASSDNGGRHGNPIDYRQFAHELLEVLLVGIEADAVVVGKGSERIRVPVPHLSKYFRMTATRRLPNLVPK